MEKFEKYSVLMSVYYKEKPEYLKESIESMLNQTVAPDQFVIVCDGEITRELDQVLLEYQYSNKNLFTIIRRKENKGLGYSLNEGLEQCRNELVARMDSDDISFNDRCEKQLNAFEVNKNLSVVGGQILEFENTIDNVRSRRIVPIKYEDIIIFSHRRSPFNHPTVMFKKSVIVQYGGYPIYKRKEDLALFVELVNKGEYCINLEDNLLYYRTSLNNRKRRKNYINSKEYIEVMYQFYKNKTINWFDFFYVVVGQLVLLITPCTLSKKISDNFLRK